MTRRKYVKWLTRNFMNDTLESNIFHRRKIPMTKDSRKKLNYNEKNRNDKSTWS